MKDIQTDWSALCRLLSEQFGQLPPMEAVLMLIGLQETGIKQKTLSKSDKMRLIQQGICFVLEPAGFYRNIGRNEEGWPKWQKIRDLPEDDTEKLELLLKNAVLKYFKGRMNTFPG